MNQPAGQQALDFNTPQEIAEARLPEGMERLATEIYFHPLAEPISAQRLSIYLQTDSRSVAASVHELITEHRLPIGSTRGAPAGYYWIKTRQELDDATRMLHNTAMQLLVREAALKRITLDALLGQMKMEWETTAIATTDSEGG